MATNLSICLSSTTFDTNAQLQRNPNPIPEEILVEATDCLSSIHIRRIILEQSKRAHVGHIGSALSIADILVALYTHVLHIPAPDDPERDRFILSKGHAALALYAALFQKGWLTQDQLNTFCEDASQLGVHPEHTL